MHWKTYLKYLPLPLLLAAYPVLFIFGQNASSLELDSLKFPLGASLFIAGLVYTSFCLLQRKPLNASLSTAAFVLFYYLYGTIFHQMVKWNRLQINPFILLALMIALAISISFLVNRIKLSPALSIQKILLVVLLALVGYNTLGIIVPVEAKKALANKPPSAPAPDAIDSTQKVPDIYYIIFDEYAGFNSIRSYWRDNFVDQFESFLKRNNFFVATGSRSPTLNTASEIASRLNLQPYSENLPNQVKMNAINNNKVMQVLKSNGYTTVAIDMAFQGIHADLDIQYDPKDIGGMAADEFQRMFLDTTMFNPFSSYLQSSNQAAIKQRDLILYSLDKTVDSGKIQSPKFIYTHILLPHEPFIFDARGNLLPAQAADNWDDYLGQLKYSTQLAEQLITRLLSNADPNNPPVIILQSDHGARNIATKAADGTILNTLLQNYPPEDMHDILNALYLPGYDTSQLSNTMDPTGTFAIILNYYLKAGVSVNNTPVK